MPYSSWGDFICGAFVLIIIIFHFLNKSKKNTALKLVLFILVSVLIFNVLHGVSDLLVYNKVTLKLALIFKYLSIIVFSIIASGFEIYCLGVIKDTTKILKWHYLILVLPVLWNIIWLIINKITNICFEVEGNTIIYHVAYCLLFLCFIFAMIYMPIMCLVYKRGIYPSLFKVGLTFTIFSALFGIFQFFFSFFINNNVFFTSVFLTLSTAYTYLYSRNDLINIDQMTNLYMRNKCMDDFGTGFSNLKAVLSLPFYLIKIDKSLLDAAKENTRNQQILDGVVKAINSIGMKTLIEGVETKEDVELVKNFGVNYIQGYYYHKPSNMTELNKTIEEKV